MRHRISGLWFLLVTACGAREPSSEPGALTTRECDRAHPPCQVVPPGDPFLRVCLEPADCPEPLTCELGMCTDHCETNRDCTRHTLDAFCSSDPRVLHAAESWPEPEGGAVCLLPCSSSMDCDALGPTAVCHDGRCRRPARVDVSDGGTALGCEERLAALESRLARTVADADRTCERDLDCLQVIVRTTCYWDVGAECAASGYVSRAGLATIEAELSAVEQGSCPALLESGCSDPVRPDAVVFCPMYRRARSCQDGRCN